MTNLRGREHRVSRLVAGLHHTQIGTRIQQRRRIQGKIPIFFPLTDIVFIYQN